MINILSQTDLTLVDHHSPLFLSEDRNLKQNNAAAAISSQCFGQVWWGTLTLLITTMKMGSQPKRTSVIRYRSLPIWAWPCPIVELETPLVLLKSWTRLYVLDRDLIFPPS